MKQREEEFIAAKKLDEEFSVLTENPISEIKSDTSLPTVTSADKGTVEAESIVKEEEVPAATKIEEIYTAPAAATMQAEEAEDSASRDTLVGIENMPGYKSGKEEEAVKEEEDEEETLQSDLERLKAAQEQGGAEEEEEVAPSVDEAIEIFKKVLYAEQVPITMDLTHYADMGSRKSMQEEQVATAEKAALFEEEKASIVGFFDGNLIVLLLFFC